VLRLLIRFLRFVYQWETTAKNTLQIKSLILISCTSMFILRKKYSTFLTVLIQNYVSLVSYYSVDYVIFCF